ncbi:MAG TPA: hypothetical protein VIU38_09640 [Anaerolineales bacterium]
MRNFIAIPLLGLAVIVQSAILGQFPLLSGTADVVLVVLAAWALQESVTTSLHWALLAAVMVSLVSSLPWVIYVVGYVSVVVLALLLQRRVWQVPMLAMFIVTFAGTVLLHALTYVYLSFSAGRVALSDALGLVTLPSVLLNMLIAIPVFGFMRDVSNWVYPTAEAA